MKVTLYDVTLSVPDVYVATSVNGGTPRFHAHLLFRPDHPAAKIVREAMVAAAKETWAEKAGAIFKTLSQDKKCLHDGAEKAGTTLEESYKGFLFLSVANKTKPTLVDNVAGPDGKPADLSVDTGAFYSGVQVNAIVDIYCWKHTTGGFQCNATLMGLQCLRKGVRLSGGGVASAGDFEAIPNADPFGEEPGPSSAGLEETADPFA
jgi:Enterobacter phage Enc34, ssDNA-binding protein